MSKNELIKQNNELRKQLTPENKKYYEDILIYIRININKDEQQTEELLLEILQDILEAQKNGTSAQEFFGKEPKEISDALLSELPNASRKSLSKFIFLFFLLLLQFTLFNHLLQPVVALSFVNTLLPILLLIITVILGLAAIKFSTFARDKIKSYSFALLAFICWNASIIIPTIDDPQPHFEGQLVFSHQTFAAILFILTIGLLAIQFHFKMNPISIYITITFAILEGAILLKVIDPIFAANKIQLCLWIIILLIFTSHFFIIKASQKK